MPPDQAVKSSLEYRKIIGLCQISTEQTITALTAVKYYPMGRTRKTGRA